MQSRELLSKWRQATFAWVRAHKIGSFFLVLGTWFFLEFATLPYGSVGDLKTKNPGETAFMREQREQAERDRKPFKIVQRWIPLTRISKDAVSAVIVSEDGTFWSNSGFDWFEFRESIEKNVKEGRAARGASTITQQLVKNLFLSSSKNPLRKLKEWVLTWYMDQKLSKQRILELYLNVIEWGRGIYGIEAASEIYFGKPASALTREEGARLAAVIPSPRRLRVDNTTKYLQRRSELILSRMTARGL
jgi:monofunctional glycosyltransferase